MAPLWQERYSVGEDRVWLGERGEEGGDRGDSDQREGEGREVGYMTSGFEPSKNHSKLSWGKN
jgi:hypothetical protein